MKKQTILTKETYEAAVAQAVTQALSKQFAAWGKKGGDKNKKKGTKYFRELGKKSAIKRWGKTK